MNPLGHVPRAFDREVRSPVRWMTSVGVVMAGSAWRASICPFMRDEGVGRTRAGAHSEIGRPPRPEVFVVDEAGRSPLQTDRSLPSSGGCLPRNPRTPPEERPRDSPPAHSRLAYAPIMDQRSCPLRVGGCKQEAHGTTFGVSHEGGPFGAHSVHDARTSSMRCSSVGRSSSGTRSDRPVPRLSKQDEARERGKSPQEAGERRLLPEVARGAIPIPSRTRGREAPPRPPGRRCSHRRSVHSVSQASSERHTASMFPERPSARAPRAPRTRCRSRRRGPSPCSRRARRPGSAMRCNTRADVAPRYR